MKNLGEADQARVARFVDGQMAGQEAAEFERRLLREPGLRASVEEQREVKEWFRQHRAAEQEASASGSSRPSPGFVEAVIRGARRLPSRETLAGEAAVPGEVGSREGAAVRTARLLMAAAAVVLALSLLVASGLLQPPDSGELQAQQERVKEIDRQMLEAAHRSADRQPR